MTLFRGTTMWLAAAYNNETLLRYADRMTNQVFLHASNVLGFSCCRKHDCLGFGLLHVTA